MNPTSLKENVYQYCDSTWNKSKKSIAGKFQQNPFKINMDVVRTNVAKYKSIFYSLRTNANSKLIQIKLIIL